MVVKNRLFTVVFLTLLAAGCPKKTEPAPPAAAAPPPAAEEPAAETPSAQADPADVAAGLCDCVLRHPRTTDREGGAACVKTLMAEKGIAEPDPNTPPYTRTTDGVTQNMPRIFPTDAEMDAYVDATNKCLMEIGQIDAKYKAQAWTDAPCEEQCGAEPEANQALCNAHCGAKE